MIERDTNSSDIHGPVKVAASGCLVCKVLRDAGAGACTTHVVIDDWRARGHGSLWEAAASYLAYLDDLLGALMPADAALVGAGTIARFADARGPVPSRLEAFAAGADLAPASVGLALAERKGALRGAA